MSETAKILTMIDGTIVEDDGTYTKITAPSDLGIEVRASYYLQGEYGETSISLDPSETVKYTNNRDLWFGVRPLSEDEDLQALNDGEEGEFKDE